MLLGGKQPDIKQVAVVTRNQKFSRLLSRILADWKFHTVDNVSEATVVFVERGLEPPTQAERVVWLTPMPLSEGTFLTIPISLSQLYHLLETRFFPTPRRHIRVAMEVDVDLKIENDWLEGRLISLSDRGGRITCSIEIPRGKLLNIELKLAGKTLRIPSEVLYCIPAGDSPGRSQPQIGVLFKPTNDREFDMLRRFVEKICIEAACAREEILLKDSCVSWLEVPTDPFETTT